MSLVYLNFIVSEEVYCLGDFDTIYCKSATDKEIISSLSRYALQANAQGNAEQASYVMRCMKGSLEFLKGSLAGGAEEAFQRGLEMVISAQAAKILTKIILKVGTRTLVPLQVGMAIYGIYQNGHILKADYNRIQDALAKGDMYALGNTCAHAVGDTIDAILGLKASKNLIKAIAAPKTLAPPVAQAIHDSTHQAQQKTKEATNTAFCPDHTNYQRKENCHPIHPSEIAHCTPDTTHINKLEEIFKKITDKATLTTQRIKHLLAPDIRCYRGQKPTISGWHHDYQGKIKQTGTFDVKVIQTHTSGAYEVVWSYKGSETKTSTFFPDHWTTEEVITKIGEAYMNQFSRKVLNNGKLELKGKTSCGLKILIALSANNEIISAYPVLE